MGDCTGVLDDGVRTVADGGVAGARLKLVERRAVEAGCATVVAMAVGDRLRGTTAGVVTGLVAADSRAAGTGLVTDVRGVEVGASSVFAGRGAGTGARATVGRAGDTAAGVGSGDTSGDRATGPVTGGRGLVSVVDSLVLRENDAGLRLGGCGAARRGAASSRGKLTRRVATSGGHSRLASSGGSSGDVRLGDVIPAGAAAAAAGRGSGDASDGPRENGSPSNSPSPWV